MHAEHAELISALRAENRRLNSENATLRELQTVIDAQDEVLAKAQRLIVQQQDVIADLRNKITQWMEEAP